MEKNEKLSFAEFDPVDKKAWLAKVTKDLKGKDPADVLTWKTLEGIDVPAYRTPEDPLPHLRQPEFSPNRLEDFPNGNSWEIRQDFVLGDLSDVNREILTALESGVNSLGIKGSITSREDMLELFEGIYVDMISTNFSPQTECREFLEIFLKEVKVRNINTESITGSIEYDPLGERIRTGKWITDQKNDLVVAEELIRMVCNNLPNYRSLHVEADLYHEAGATMVEELAFALAHGHEYVVLMREAGLPSWAILKSMQFSFSTGQHYFLEIAKYRAFRRLWELVAGKHPAEKDIDTQPYIIARTSGRELTVYDAHNNLVRGTTQSMSAVIGGCNSLLVRRFDAAYKGADAFSNRMARNIQNILKDEANLDKVLDPSQGSYYIEHLTDILAEKAWETFKEIEQQGGWMKTMKSGWISERIQRSAEARKQALDSGDLVLTGVNKYPQKSQKMADKWQPESATAEADATTLIPQRTAASMEQQRLTGESEASTTT